MDIKPIETHYKGHRFRSRLEARWAVFFNALGLPFQYEVEGYQLPIGGRYLPDFYLPTEGCYVEIKPGPRPAACFDANGRPVSFSKLPREIRLMAELCRDLKKPGCVFYGDPVEVFAPNYPGLVSVCWEDFGYGYPSFCYLHDFESAAYAARSARFEFGEVGA